MSKKEELVPPGTTVRQIWIIGEMQHIKNHNRALKLLSSFGKTFKVTKHSSAGLPNNRMKLEHIANAD